MTSDAPAHRDVPIHGLMAEFLKPEEILSAARRAREAGYRRMDAYTPYSVEGVSAALGMRRSPIPSVVFIGGLTGAAIAFWMQYYSMSISYPFDVGGKPTNSWPAFIPIAFEVLVLIASFSAVVATAVVCGLPRPHHPVFAVPSFARASQDRFFLCIEAVDPLFDRTATARFLLSLAPHDVVEVPQEELIEATPAEEHSSVRLSEEAYQTPTAVGAK
jgi:Alternative complex III, ActD subunit